jgi:large subunit ribosomal protein L31
MAAALPTRCFPPNATRLAARIRLPNPGCQAIILGSQNFTQTLRGDENSPPSSGSPAVKKEIHPEYVDSKVHCACGNEFMTRATRKEIKVDICAACHPFYTGRQKFVDAAGRVERFQKKFAGNYFQKPGATKAKAGAK